MVATKSIDLGGRPTSRKARRESFGLKLLVLLVGGSPVGIWIYRDIIISHLGK